MRAAGQEADAVILSEIAQAIWDEDGHSTVAWRTVAALTLAPSAIATTAGNQFALNTMTFWLTAMLIQT